MSGPAGTRPEASFVGRADEVRSLQAAVDSALRGESAGALVIGEAGMGKTRLAREVATTTRTAGARVVWASAWEPGGAPAHWHWVQVLRSLAAGLDRRTLLRTLGSDAEELARLVPDLRSGVQLARPAAAEGDDPRFRMYDAVASFLRRLCARGPSVVVLDDLHAGDVGSVRLLHFLLTETIADHLAVVATTRDPDTEPVGDELRRALVEAQRVTPPIRLGGLARGEVEELLTQIVVPELASRLAPAIHRRSGGNPLFVGELGRFLAAEPREGDGALPPSVRAVLERRLRAVPPRSLDILRVAAVVGEEFSLTLVEEAAGKTREQLLDALDDGVRARLLTGRGAAAFAFTHSLVRDALYDDVALAPRALLHRRIAEILESRGEIRTPPAELARHFLAGAAAVEDGKAATFAERAGRRAAEQLAYEDAADHFRSALGALEFAGADESRRIPLLLALGNAALGAGDLPAARRAFVEGADRARGQGRPDLLAEAALGLGSGLDGFEVRLFDHAQITLLEEALAALDPAPSVLRAWAMARLSVALTFAEPEARRRQLADDAVAMARTVDDRRVLAYALAARCDATAGPEHIDERLGAATEIVRLARAAGDPRTAGDRGMELLGRRNRLIALLESGDLAGVDTEIDRYQLVAGGLGRPVYQWYVPLWRGMRALTEGRIDLAHRRQAEAASVGARAQSHNAALNADVLAWNILLKEGRWSEAADRLARQLPLASGIYSEAFWVAIVTPHDHRVEAASILERFAAERFARFPRDAVWLAAMTYLADTCGVVGHAAAAEQLYELVLPHRSRFAVDAIGAACYGSMSRPLGVLATVLGRRADAAAHFEEALEAHRAGGATGLVAETLHDLGSSQRSFGDHQGAERTLADSRSIYQSLGMEARAALIHVTPEIPRRQKAPPTAGAFRLEGGYWTLTYDGRTTHVADAKGLHDIAALLARPGREVHVADLIAATDPATGAVPARTRVAVVERSPSDAVLDGRARAEYRARLLELRDELEEAEANADLGRAEAARAAMDLIAGELGAALGLGGRARNQPDAAERARKAVTQRIRNAVKRLAGSHPELAAHLDRSLRTGRFCSYAPERPVDWAL